MAAAKQGKRGTLIPKSWPTADQHWPGQPTREAEAADRQQVNGQGLSINTYQPCLGHLTGVSSDKCHDH